MISLCHMAPKTIPLEERFWKHVNKLSEDECWPWTGATTRGGYAQLSVGRYKPDATIWGVHRLSYILHKGEIPDGMLILHSCDNPRCVNPKHLRVGTTLDNMRDRHAKGHYSVGSQNTAAKLTEADVAEIRRIYNTSRTSTKVIAKQFSITREHAWNIATRRSWKHIP